MDLDWLWEVTIREYRLRLNGIYGRLRRYRKDFIVVATSMVSGKAMYLRPDERTLEYYLKVSSALPLLYRTELAIGSERAADGGIADSIPVAEAYRRGASRITVIRTRPSGYVMKKSRISPVYPIIFRNNPFFKEALMKRAENYNGSLGFIKHPPAGVTVDEIAPPAGHGPGRATRDMHALRAAYECGREMGNEYINSWKNGGTSR